MSLPITVVAGLDRGSAKRPALHLHGDAPGASLVEHCLDPLDAGLVSRASSRIGTALIDLAHGCVSCTLLCDALPHVAADPAVLLPAAAQQTGLPGRPRSQGECRIGTVVAGRCRVEPDGPEARAWTSGRIASAAGAGGRGPASLPHPQEGTAPAAGGDTPGQELQRPSSGCNARQGVQQRRRGTPAPGAFRRRHRQHQDSDRDAPDAGEALVAGTGASLATEQQEARRDYERSEFGYQAVAGAWRIQWRSSRPLHPKRLREALADIAEIALRGTGHVLLAGCPKASERSSTGGSALCFIGVSDRWHVIHDRLRHAELTDEELR